MFKEERDREEKPFGNDKLKIWLAQMCISEYNNKKGLDPWPDNNFTVGI